MLNQAPIFLNVHQFPLEDFEVLSFKNDVENLNNLHLFNK